MLCSITTTAGPHTQAQAREPSPRYATRSVVPLIGILVLLIKKVRVGASRDLVLGTPKNRTWLAGNQPASQDMFLGPRFVPRSTV